MKKLVIFITLLLCFATLQRTTDYVEVSEMSFVSSIGFDYDQETSEYLVYFYIINKFNLSLSQLALGSNDVLAYIAEGKGTSLNEAFNMIKKNTSIYYRFSSIQTIVIKDTFVDNNHLLALCDFLIDSVEVYPNYIVFFTKDKLVDVYKIGNFSETSSYFTILVNSTTKNDYLKCNFSTFCNDLYVKDCTIPYPTLKVTEDIFYDQNDYFNSLSINGLAFIQNDNQDVHFYDSLYPQLKWLSPLRSNIINFDKIDYQIKQYKISYHINKNKLKIKVKIKGYATNNAENLDYQTINNIVYQKIYKDLYDLKKIFDEEKIDVFNINYISNYQCNYLNTGIEVFINNKQIE